MHVSTSSEYWINPNALTIELNYFDNPNYIQVGLLSSAVIMAYSEGIIDFDQAHNFRTWNIIAQDTYLNSTQSVYVYARLERDETKKEALIIYDREYRAIDGSIVKEGNVIGSPSENYFYILLGKISSAIDSAGKERMREWEQVLSYGTLKTDYQNAIDGNDKFLLKKFYDSLIHTYDDKMNRVPSNSNADDIKWLEIAPKLKALFARFESSETKIANILEKIVFGNPDNTKELIDLATSKEIVNTPKTADNIAASTAWVDAASLSKIKPDSTSFLLKLLGGAEVGEAIDSMVAGKGTILTDNGRIQTDRLEVRGSMTVMELIINRLQAMEADYSFSESGTIKKVDVNLDGTYRLWMRKRWENDFTAVKINDIIYGNTLNLSGDADVYITSWMRVVNVNISGNYIDVVIYPDNEVPGGKNYLPVELMVITRRGNPVDEDRQAYWYLSSNEHCICMLDGVTKPILEESNYSIIVGRLKQLSLFDNLPINYKQSYVYCRGIATQDLFEIDYQGTVTKREVNRMFWSLEEAKTNPYLNTNEVYHVVSHYGCEWVCLVSNTLQEPKFGCSDWAMIRGNPAFSIDIKSSEGWGEFDVLTFETTLTVTGMLYNQDVTDKILDADVSWSRESGNLTEDNAWTAAHAGYGKTLKIDRNELGPDYMTIRRCNFKATALLRDGRDVAEANDIIYF